jgi:hypothetical protein
MVTMCPYGYQSYAQVAQLVEQRTENPRVAGSIPALGTPFLPFHRRTTLRLFLWRQECCRSPTRNFWSQTPNILVRGYAAT